MALCSRLLTDVRSRRLLLVLYYVAVLTALVLMYGINAPSAPPFVYQGF